jgi:molybdate transport system substrate-binding protein
MRAVAGVVALVFAFAIVPDSVESAAQGAAEVHVAAASDLRFALEELTARFERTQGVRVRTTLGSSGQLAAQIAQGAPFDVFFSADEAFVHSLAQQGAIRRDSIRLYAVGRIAVWVRADSPLDVSQGLAVLADRRIRYVAIANPAHAPYGRAAEEALKRIGMYERVRGKLVLAENVSQALQFAQTGNADVGIIALSLAAAPPVKASGRYWIIPSSRHQPIRQAAGVATRSRQAAVAASFLAFVNGSSGRAVMRRYGFSLPGEEP